MYLSLTHYLNESYEKIIIIIWFVIHTYKIMIYNKNKGKFPFKLLVTFHNRIVIDLKFKISLKNFGNIE